MSFAPGSLDVTDCTVKPAGPDRESLTFTVVVTGTSRRFGRQRVLGLAAQVTAGGVASRLIVTLALAVPPAEVALQAKVVPAVSPVTLAGPQPLDGLIGDSGSVTTT